MRWYALLLMSALMSCSRPDFDTSVLVQAWLESRDPNAEIIEVRCTGNIEDPPGSGKWREWEHTDTWSAKEVLVISSKRGRDWADILVDCTAATKRLFPNIAFREATKNMTEMERMVRRMSFQLEDVRCEGKALKSPPPIQVGRCPNDVDGCDEPPMATDLPPPLPPSPGGGDF